MKAQCLEFFETKFQENISSANLFAVASMKNSEIRFGCMKKIYFIKNLRDLM